MRPPASRHKEGSPASSCTARWRALFQLFCKCPGTQPSPRTSQPLSHHWLGDKGCWEDVLPFPFSFVRRLRSFGKEQSQELDGSRCPFSHHLFPLPPSSGAANARTGSWLIIHHQLLLKQPQTKLQKPLRLQDINSSQHKRQM